MRALVTVKSAGKSAAKILAGSALLLMSGQALAWQGEKPAWMTERRIIGANQLEKIEKAAGTDAYNFARPVARVEDNSGSGFCTGWRVAEDIFITNYHCFEAVPCNDTVFHLGTEDEMPRDQQQRWKCDKVLHSIEKYDVAVYLTKRLNDESYAEEAYPFVSLWAGPITDGQMLQVAGHPAARTKEIDRGPDCKILSATPSEQSSRVTITHTCDTEGGSSGSPVMDRTTGYAVALHWGGTNTHNLAIPMYEVVKELRANLAPEYFEKLTIVEP